MERSSMRERVWRLVDATRAEDEFNIQYDRYDWFIQAFVVMTVLVVILDTVDKVHRQYGHVFYLMEGVAVCVFLVDYLLRLWSCVEDPRYRSPIMGRLRFMVAPSTLIDASAIAPLFFPLLGISDRYTQMVRMLRMLRLLKLFRYVEGLHLISRVFRSKKDELVLSTIILGLLLVLTSSFIYFAEHRAQPDKFPDIPSAMWWSVVTLTTVGYGDVFPITILGKFLAGFSAILGVGFFALPAAILTSAFIEELGRRGKLEPLCCPHCHETFEPSG